MPVEKNSYTLRYENDFLKHEAHFCSKFKNKLKTMPASAANKPKTNKKKFQTNQRN